MEILKLLNYLVPFRSSCLKRDIICFGHGQNVIPLLLALGDPEFHWILVKDLKSSENLLIRTTDQKVPGLSPGGVT